MAVKTRLARNLLLVAAMTATLLAVVSALPPGKKTIGPRTVYGRIQLVDSFPDAKVKVVTSFPDLRVQKVKAFANSPGKWEIVDSFPDYRVQIVDSFPDFTIEYVDSFPGPTGNAKGEKR